MLERRHAGLLARLMQVAGRGGEPRRARVREVVRRGAEAAIAARRTEPSAA
jgi:hypothetical protein